MDPLRRGSSEGHVPLMARRAYVLFMAASGCRTDNSQGLAPLVWADKVLVLYTGATKHAKLLTELWADLELAALQPGHRLEGGLDCVPFETVE
jgi:hypothetical protein